MCSIKAPQVNVPQAPVSVQVPVLPPTAYVSPENDPNSPVGMAANQVTRKKLRTDLALPSAGGTGPAAGAGLTIPPRV